jgi:hypothetical protein
MRRLLSDWFIDTGGVPWFLGLTLRKKLLVEEGLYSIK